MIRCSNSGSRRVSSFVQATERKKSRRKLRDPELFLVAEGRGRILAAVMGAWDGRRGWIYRLAVTPKAQRRGVGTILVRELERRMSRKGVVKGNAVVYRDNRKSRWFFKNLGYQLDERGLLFGNLLHDKD